jgi:hypothetical protein
VSEREEGVGRKVLRRGGESRDKMHVGPGNSNGIG